MKNRIIPGALAVAVVAALSVGAVQAGKTPRSAANVSTDNLVQSDAAPVRRFIIEYRDGTVAKTSGAAAANGVQSALVRSGLARNAGKSNSVAHVRTLGTGHQLVRVNRMLDAVEADALLRQIAMDPAVKSVTPDRMRQITSVAAQPQFVPNDPDFQEYQWHMRAPDGGTTYDGGPNRGGANVSAAWDLADGNGVTIAVLDTGITAHPDVNTADAGAGYDFITDAFVSGRATNDRVPGGWDLGDWTVNYPGAETCQQRNSSWHGTHVAGSAGAQLTDNGIGMSGIAYAAKHIPVRVLGHCGGMESDIVDAIIWAAGGTVAGVPANPNPAHVINLSLGGSGACSSAEAAAIAQANSLGATVVIAAGNSNSDVANFSPANCPGAIAVASNGVTSRRAYYSNYGDGIDISAPGGGVYANDGSSGSQIFDGFVWQAKNPSTTSPIPSDQIDPTAPNASAGSAGTSQASPHVAGVVALMQGARLDADLPLLTPSEVLDILKQTATPFAVAPAANRAIGPGIVNAAAAVAKAVEPPCEENCAPPATPISNAVPVRSLSGTAGGETLYSIEVPAGVSGPLSITTTGGSGDVSLHVSLGEAPADSGTWNSSRPGNAETIRINAPAAGTYYIKLKGVRAYSNVTLQARFTSPGV